MKLPKVDTILEAVKFMRFWDRNIVKREGYYIRLLNNEQVEISDDSGSWFKYIDLDDICNSLKAK